MALNTKAARALEQVKNGLSMLYGADYFTEEEWIKIDGLIHKGEYVFTTGPPKTSFLEDELISFDDGNVLELQAGAQKDLQPPEKNEPKEAIAETTEDVEKHIERANRNEDHIENANRDENHVEATIEQRNQNDSMDPSADIFVPSVTPLDGNIPETLEISSDEEPVSASEPTKYDSEKQPFDLSPPTSQEPEPVEPAFKEPSFELSSGLSQPPSQDQEYAEKSFEEPEPVEESSFELSSGLSQPPSQEPERVTKREFKELVKREPVDRPANGGLAYYSKEQLDELKAFNSGLTRAKGPKKKAAYEKAQDSYPTPDASEKDPWTGEEVYQKPSNDYPSPATTDEDSRVHNWAAGVGSQANTAPPSDQKTKLVNDFIKSHGRMPKSINDIYQPQNSGFTPMTSRPASRATSIRPVKTSVSGSVASVVEALNPGSTQRHLKVASGTVLIAQSNAEASPGRLRIEIQEGDQIKVIKHVSGALHYGKNMRTSMLGQFNESIFRRPSAAQTAATNARMHAINQSIHRVEGFERVNASEWDEVPVTRPKTVAPAPIRPAVGLGASRYAVLADTQSENSESGHLTREDVDKLVNERVDERVKKLLENGNAANPGNAGRSSRTSRQIVEPLQKVEPKTATCWFWATPGKDCRFTADECRDLHDWADTDPNGNPANLRMGKPTWGALADANDGPTSPLPVGHNIRLSSHLQGSRSGFTPVESSAPNTSKFTCHFWANEGKCQYSSEECKYLHDWSPNGTARAPGKAGSRMRNWNRFGDKPQAQNNQSGGWGDSSAWGGESTNTDAWGQANTNTNAWESNENGHEEAEGEMVLEEVKNEEPVTSWGGGGGEAMGWEVSENQAAAWGQTLDPKDDPNSASVSAWGDVDTGKPAHVRALEEKARVESLGW